MMENQVKVMVVVKAGIGWILPCNSRVEMAEFSELVFQGLGSGLVGLQVFS